ncbi:hypothetical protein Psed_4876 [Pseudonocardia dioxanivorans CB1190]|jgi:hypothetical protein|uniref:SseB protein N-terminal domain-containing protein n=1 Tax=Pseudonocardia dioxanivorans (strain ATCC 55486 / DSM 44775 / JCM 13855 / CB1190) TaxID=675635 RepID=F4CJZ5_PSEUX|nr:hypothetical protein Psed_4876 [Pseudonocardia dioxanivorans CB1190]
MSSPASHHDIDRLAAAVRDQRTPAGFAALWRAIFALESWYLLPTGTPDDPRPMLGLVEERSYLLVFTSERHLRSFANDRSAVRANDGVAAMTISPASLADLVPGLVEQGITGVLFDQGHNDVAAPLAALGMLYDVTHP